MTRDEVCARYQRKVVLLARRVHERLSSDSGVTLDELVSSGGLGLLEAFERFDATRGIQFTTYAEYRIRGAMYDDLRKGDTFTRRRRDMAKRIAYAQEMLSRQLGRDPAPEEVAEALEMSLDEYWHQVERVRPQQHVSLDGPSGDGDEEERPLVDRLVAGDQPAPDARLMAQDMKRTLAEAIAELPERQRHCVQMYYGKEMSLAEIAAVYEVTVSRVSQILGDARRKLKKRLAPVVEPADLVMG